VWLGSASLHGRLAFCEAELAAHANLYSLSHGKDLTELHLLTRDSQVEQNI